jgi:hypothetical protein
MIGLLDVCISYSLVLCSLFKVCLTQMDGLRSSSIMAMGALCTFERVKGKERNNRLLFFFLVRLSHLHNFKPFTHRLLPKNTIIPLQIFNGLYL